MGGYHEYRGGYLEYRGGCSVPWGDINVGDIMSNVPWGENLLLFETVLHPHSDIPPHIS